MNKVMMSAAVLALLSACGGSSSGSGSPAQTFEVPDFDNVGLNQLENRAERLIDTYEGVSATATLPDSGGAEMTGVIGLYEGDDPSNPEEADFLGEMAVAVDFADGTVEGRAGNFRVRDSRSSVRQLDGTLAFDATIRNSGAVVGNLSGRLSAFDAVDFDIPMEGTFIGDGADALFADGVGTSNGEGGEGAASASFLVD